MPDGFFIPSVAQTTADALTQQVKRVPQQGQQPAQEGFEQGKGVHGLDLSQDWPDWYARGTPVPDLHARSDDACAILDGDFENDHGVDVNAMVWRECLVPVSEFRLGYPRGSLEECIAHFASLHVGGRSDAARQERERCEGVDRWMRAQGGADAALGVSPLLLTILADGRLRLEDGHHRLAVAEHVHGARHVRALCAPMPAAEPKVRLRP